MIRIEISVAAHGALGTACRPAPGGLIKRTAYLLYRRRRPLALGLAPCPVGSWPQPWRLVSRAFPAAP